MLTYFIDINNGIHTEFISECQDHNVCVLKHLEQFVLYKESQMGPLLWNGSGVEGEGEGEFFLLGFLNFKMPLIVGRILYTRYFFLTHTPCMRSVWYLWEQALCVFHLTGHLAQWNAIPFHGTIVSLDHFHRNRKFQDHIPPQSPCSLLYLTINKTYRGKCGKPSIL